MVPKVIVVLGVMAARSGYSGDGSSKRAAGVSSEVMCLVCCIPVFVIGVFDTEDVEELC